jgi:hypothetical protein
MNEPCQCGSGRKYKRCCKRKDAIANAAQSQFRPFVRVMSTNSSSAQINLTKFSVTDSSGTMDLVDDEILLGTNIVPGDKSESSVALLHFPNDGPVRGEAVTSGNAVVSNGAAHKKISVKGLKEYRCDSADGLYAIIRTKHQRDQGFDYFDLIFGVKGLNEGCKSSGKKERPHISFYPSGAGKYVRMASYGCTLQSETEYDSESKSFIPKLCRIIIPDRKVALELKFDESIDGQINLCGIKFVNLN